MDLKEFRRLAGMDPLVESADQFELQAEETVAAEESNDSSEAETPVVESPELAKYRQQIEQYLAEGQSLPKIPAVRRPPASIYPKAIAAKEDVEADEIALAEGDLVETGETKRANKAAKRDALVLRGTHGISPIRTGGMLKIGRKRLARGTDAWNKKQMARKDPYQGDDIDMLRMRHKELRGYDQAVESLVAEGDLVETGETKRANKAAKRSALTTRGTLGMPKSITSAPKSGETMLRVGRARLAKGTDAWNQKQMNKDRDDDINPRQTRDNERKGFDKPKSRSIGDWAAVFRKNKADYNSNKPTSDHGLERDHAMADASYAIHRKLSTPRSDAHPDAKKLNYRLSNRYKGSTDRDTVAAYKEAVEALVAEGADLVE